MYLAMFRQFQKMLGNLDRWLATAEQYAEAKKFDPNLLLGFRLAPDQFELVKQVQGACDTLKLSAARLAGKDAPSHPDTEKTVAELHARVASVLAYLGTFTAEDFAGTDARRIALPRFEGKWMKGADYFAEHTVPNFFFHVDHTYAILRHNGVPLGKRDYLGTMTLQAA